jgi:hypothetical protein
MSFSFITIRKSVLMLLLLALFVSTGSALFITKPKTAHAQAGTVPIGTAFNYHNIVSNLKDFLLDNLATQVANQILNRLTVSVVNWINGGFQGSPAFVTNPAGFFLDIADQQTGRFLAKGGPLALLCSPFQIDIRLALALDSTVSESQRYRCTLGAIVNNVNGTIEGFTGGDFSQGGWRGFISLTTQNQNNVYGSYVEARSELLKLIADDKDTQRQDLDRGNGFLSFPSCKKMSVEEAEQEFGERGINSSEELTDAYNKKGGLVVNTGGGTSIKARADANGGLEYQDCKTVTPGSVIGGQLETQLSSPTRKLELVNNINAVVNALVSQMVNQMLSGGLSALSSGNSSGGKAYTQKIVDSIENSRILTAKKLNAQLKTLFGPAISSLEKYNNLYEPRLEAVTKSREKYQAARACFETGLTKPANSSATSYMNNIIAEIDATVSLKVDPILNRLKLAQDTTNDQINSLNQQKDGLASSSAEFIGYDIEQVRDQLPSFESAIKATTDINSAATTGLPAAEKEVKAMDVQIKAFNTQAIQYQTACRNLPNTNTLIDIIP